MTDEIDKELDEFYAELQTSANKGLFPKLRASGAFISRYDADMQGNYNVQACLELGAMILMGKPLVLVVEPGATLPPKLTLIADRIIEADLDTEAGRLKLQEGIKAFLEETA